MATYPCPKGHASTDPDYCSECGALISQASAPKAPPAIVAATAGAEVCPDCMTPRVPGARFCEVCRHEFAASPPAVAASAPVPAAAASAAVAVASAAPPPVVASTPAAASAPPPSGAPVPNAAAPLSVPAPRLNVVVIADPTLAETEEQRAQCPQGQPELIFPLDLEENLVGRRSDAKKIYPEIDISDPGISHRHLKFVRQPEGGFTVLELGSANGTTMNGVELRPGLVTPIAAGDELLIGMWTRLRIRSR